MSTKQKFLSLRILSLIVLLSFSLGASGQNSSPQDENTPQTEQHVPLPSLDLVVLVDIHPHQNKVLPVELSIAEEVLHKVEQPGNTFSLIVFGSQAPVLVKSTVPASDAISAIRNVTLEQTEEENFTVHLSSALNLALGQFKGDTGPKSLLVISEGNDDFTDKIFKQTVARARQIGVACHVVLVADHPLRGSKSIQIYGFNLRRLAGKTHGRYVEVLDQQKNLLRYARTLSDGILGQEQNRPKVQQ